MDKNITIVGGGDSTGLKTAELAARCSEIGAAHMMINRCLYEQKIKSFGITRLPEFEEPFIYPREEVFNHKKHIETCAKNRAKRKKKKRRN